MQSSDRKVSIPFPFTSQLHQPPPFLTCPPGQVAASLHDDRVLVWGHWALAPAAAAATSSSRRNAMASAGLTPPRAALYSAGHGPHVSSFRQSSPQRQRLFSDRRAGVIERGSARRWLGCASVRGERGEVLFVVSKRPLAFSVRVLSGCLRCHSGQAE